MTHWTCVLSAYNSDKRKPQVGNDLQKIHVRRMAAALIRSTAARLIISLGGNPDIQSAPEQLQWTVHQPPNYNGL